MRKAPKATPVVVVKAPPKRVVRKKAQSPNAQTAGQSTARRTEESRF